MKLRKFAIMGLSLFAFAGFSMAADDESPLAKLMEQVQNKTNAIRKATRNAAEYKKASGSIAKDAETIVKLAREAREIKEPAEKEKKPMAEWQKLMDDMIKSTEDLAKVTAKSGSTQAHAKEAFTAYTKTCTACHNVFKKDE